VSQNLVPVQGKIPSTTGPAAAEGLRLLKSWLFRE
jgi:hypothetical protein